MVEYSREKTNKLINNLKGEKSMIEIIKEVAEVVRDLQTLCLIEPDSVTSFVKQDEKGEYIIRIGFRTVYTHTDLCNKMFDSVRQ